MSLQHLSYRRTWSWSRRTLMCALCLLLILLFSAPTADARAAEKLQPYLRALVAAQPDVTLNVIVQKTVADQSIETLVAELGGTVTTDLHIINAFAAELPAKQVVQLARSDGVRWVSVDGAVADTGGPDGTVSTSKLANAYDRAIGADKLWAQGYQGSSVTVAILDSGLNSRSDFGSRIVTRQFFSTLTSDSDDEYGHGTHVAGIIGGNGSYSSGTYIGIAPKVKLISVKVTDNYGMAKSSDVVNGLQWINDNRAAYNIKVVNLSLNSTVNQSYNVDPIDAAVEILWFNQIVVVVSAGNNGSATLYPPANDPFVITVGATDDKGTASISDDTMASFSAYGTTVDGFQKPDLVAPGTNITSLLSASDNKLVVEHPANKVGSYYFRMSGTSMSAPMVAGAAALLLQDEPNLNPDQVKYRLKATANKNWAGYNATKAGAGYLDVYAAVTGTSTQTANTGTAASQLLWSGSQPVTWGSVNWGSVNWGTVNWGSVNWGSVNWGSVNWGSDYWGP